MFGSPTSLLFRADLVRSRDPFYNERNLHADSEICFDLLRGVDFGFVQEVLTYTRRHNESVSSFSKTIATLKAGPLVRLLKYGKDYLNGFLEGLGDKAKTMVVAQVPYEVADPTIDSQIISFKAAGAEFDMTETMMTTLVADIEEQIAQ